MIHDDLGQAGERERGHGEDDRIHDPGTGP
jgi:hypothetical protein